LHQESTDPTALDATDAGRRVLVVGIGALGCPAARLLAQSSSGLSAITLVDPDQIELSNLHRQPLFDDSEIGRLKAEVAATKLSRSTTCRVEWVSQRLNADNAERLIGGHDYVIDATDSPDTKFLINDVAVRLGVPFSYAGVARTAGQTMAVIPGVSACLRCVFPDGPDDDGGACSDMGILPPVAGVIASLQVAHANAYLDGRSYEAGCMTIYSLQGERFRHVAFARRERCNACAHIELSPTDARRRHLLAADQTQPDSITPLKGLEADAHGVTEQRRQSTCHS